MAAMNGDHLKFERIVQMLLVGLVTAGVAGLWAMTANIARLEERMDNYIEVQRETNQAVTHRLEQIDDRIRLIERNQYRPKQ